MVVNKVLLAHSHTVMLSSSTSLIRLSLAQQTDYSARNTLYEASGEKLTVVRSAGQALALLGHNGRNPGHPPDQLMGRCPLVSK